MPLPDDIQLQSVVVSVRALIQHDGVRGIVLKSAGAGKKGEIPPFTFIPVTITSPPDQVAATVEVSYQLKHLPEGASAILAKHVSLNPDKAVAELNRWEERKQEFGYMPPRGRPVGLSSADARARAVAARPVVSAANMMEGAPVGDEASAPPPAAELQQAAVARRTGKRQYAPAALRFVEEKNRQRAAFRLSEAELTGAIKGFVGYTFFLVIFSVVASLYPLLTLVSHL